MEKDNINIIDVDFEEISRKEEQISLELSEQGDDDDVYYEPSSVLNRTNSLIFTKYKASMVESKLLLMALYEAQKSGGTMSIEFSTPQLISALKLKKSTSIYSQIKMAAVALSKTQFWYEEPENKRFIVVNLIEGAEYNNGILKISMTDFAKKNILGLKSNFTPMQMPILMNFGTDGKRTDRANYTLRLYELLRTKLYHVTDERKSYTFKFLLSDLKLTIGAIDPSDPGIERAITMGKVLKLSDEDLEKYATKKESVTYKRYHAFDDRVLKKAQREINETDLRFEYKPICIGSSHAIKYVQFTIYRNIDLQSEEDENRLYHLIQCVEKIIKEPIKTRDIRRILSAAGNDLDKVRSAYDLASISRSQIKNLTAWMIAAIRDEWAIKDDTEDYPMEYGHLYEMRNTAEALKKAEKVKRSKRKSKNPFNDFQQNEYDFEQLEKDLLSN